MLDESGGLSEKEILLEEIKGHFRKMAVSSELQAALEPNELKIIAALKTVEQGFDPSELPDELRQLLRQHSEILEAEMTKFPARESGSYFQNMMGINRAQLYFDGGHPEVALEILDGRDDPMEGILYSVDQDRGVSSLHEVLSDQLGELVSCLYKLRKIS